MRFIIYNTKHYLLCEIRLVQLVLEDET